MKKIGIIGAGHLGFVLAKRLIAIGHSVKVANSRGALSLQAFAQQTGATAADLADVGSGVDIVIISIPLGQIRTLQTAALHALAPHTVVVDTGNYVPLRDEIIAEIEAGLPETTWVCRQLGISVVKAFNNITDFSLQFNGMPAGARGRIGLPVAADDANARAVIMTLIEELGFTAVDAGTLAESWRQQIGQPAYCTDATHDQLIGLLKRADHKTVTKNREGAMKIMAKIPADFSKPDLVRVARLMIGLDRLKLGNWLALGRLGLSMLRMR